MNIDRKFVVSSNLVNNNNEKDPSISSFYNIFDKSNDSFLSITSDDNDKISKVDDEEDSHSFVLQDHPTKVLKVSKRSREEWIEIKTFETENKPLKKMKNSKSELQITNQMSSSTSTSSTSSSTDDWLEVLRGSSSDKIIENKRFTFEQNVNSSPRSTTIPYGYLEEEKDEKGQQMYQKKNLLAFEQQIYKKENDVMIYSQPIVIERDLITRRAITDPIASVFWTFDHSASHSSSSTSSSSSSSISSLQVGMIRDVRRFRKNNVILNPNRLVISTKKMEKVLPKESEREIQLRNAMEAEDKENSRVELLFSDRFESF